MHGKLKNFFLWMAGTIVFYYLVLLLLFIANGGEWHQTGTFTAILFKSASRNPLFYLLLMLPYLIFRFIRYLSALKRRKGWMAVCKSVVLAGILPVLIIFTAFKGITWYNHQESFDYQWDLSVENLTGRSAGNYAIDRKQRGIHVFFRADVEQEVDLLVKHNVEWLTFVPYATQRDVLKPTLLFDRKAAYSRRDSAFIKQIEIAKDRGLRVLMKPHIWTIGDKWRSEISMESEEDWKEWFDQYENFILHYAGIAEKTGCEALCVGTELMQSALSRPDDWRLLIAKVRRVFSGKLVYAANWDREYKEIAFWDELDFIGVQAYFGLSAASTPSVEQLTEGWEPHKRELKAVSEKWQKPILFTEIGYKSVEGSAYHPWEWESYSGGLTQKISTETQANCYEALFRVFWHEPWFGGVHLWRWEGSEKFDFTPKGKPASNVMARWFAGQQEGDK